MCGRYTLADDSDSDSDSGGGFAARIADRLARDFPGVPVHMGEIFPSQNAPILAPAGLMVAQWGFAGKGRPLINARSETVREKPAFAASFRLRRCAVPCTGFFEWAADKTKFRFRLPDCDGAYLGGIFRDKIKNPGTSLMCGSLVAPGARYLSHILSGYLLFSGWADWFFTQDGFPAWGAKLVESLSPVALGWVYSIVYNGFYMVPELILTAIAAQLIARIPKIVVKVD